MLKHIKHGHPITKRFRGRKNGGKQSSILYNQMNILINRREIVSIYDGLNTPFELLNLLSRLNGKSSFGSISRHKKFGKNSSDRSLANSMGTSANVS